MSKSKQSLAALRKVKSDIERVIVESTNIAVYLFDTADTKWRRIGVEGGGFLALATTEPKWNFIILNRAGPENFVLDASTIMKVKLQAPYLMLRCSTEGAPCIYGLWFHSDTERDAFLVEIEKCLTSLKQVKSTTAVKTSEATVAQPAAKHDIKPDKKPSPQKTLPEKVSVPVTVAPIVETKPGMMVNKVDDVETIKCSSAIPFSDVSMRLLSPSDVTGVIRRFPKRSL